MMAAASAKPIMNSTAAVVIAAMMESAFAYSFTAAETKFW
jgi:hypothetical protein